MQSRLGGGGQGVVWHVLRGEGSQPHALKEMRLPKSLSSKRRQRFIREIEAHVELARKLAPSIIPVVDHNLRQIRSGDSRGFLVMPLARSDLSRELPYLVGRTELCLEVLGSILEGVRAAHEAGIIHRDLKPQNILFLKPGMHGVAISDFGICFLKRYRRAPLTEVGETVGTRFFMAPEQERGWEVDIDQTADVYAIGKLLHHMSTRRYLCGEELKDAFRPGEVAADPRLALLRERILKRTVVREPRRRLQSAEELLSVLGEVREELGLHE